MLEGSGGKGGKLSELVSEASAAYKNFEQSAKNDQEEVVKASTQVKILEKSRKFITDVLANPDSPLFNQQTGKYDIPGDKNSPAMSFTRDELLKRRDDYAKAIETWQRMVDKHTADYVKDNSLYQQYREKYNEGLSYQALFNTRKTTSGAGAVDHKAHADQRKKAQGYPKKGQLGYTSSER